MRSINKVILIGNLTRDPELRKTQNGQPVATFGLATNREWMTQDGQKKSLAEFHNIAAWGRLAEICSKFLKKGKLVYVEGYLKTRSWDSASGIRIFKTEIVIYDMIMLDKRPADYVPPAEQEAYQAEGEDYSQDLSYDEPIIGEEASAAEETPSQEVAPEAPAEPEAIEAVDAPAEAQGGDIDDDISKMTGESA